jgi:ERCC4-type nuclease
MILCDPRIGSKDLVGPIQKHVNCEVRLAKPQLNSGDICFSGNGPAGAAKDGGSDLLIGIELKTVTDFIASARSSRLAGFQLVNMAEDYDVCYLLIEGSIRPAKSGVLLTLTRGGWKPVLLAAKGVMYSEVFKHCLSLSILKNVIVLRSSSREETIQQIACTYQWWQREYDSHQSTEGIKLQSQLSLTRVSLLRKIASEIPGIGFTKSAAVEKAFISVSHMLNADVETWAEIPGIGERLATRIWTDLRGAR